jgi:hypothetical protein
MGELRRYWVQNNPDDYQKILCKFIERLLERGHTLEGIAPILKQTAMLLDASYTKTVRSKNSNANA